MLKVLKNEKTFKKPALNIRNAQLLVAFFLLLFSCAFHQVCEHIACIGCCLFTPQDTGMAECFMQCELHATYRKSEAFLWVDASVAV